MTCKNFIEQLSKMQEPPDLLEIHIRMRGCHSFMILNVIKTIAPKIVLMKGVYPHRPRDL